MEKRRYNQPENCYENLQVGNTKEGKTQYPEHETGWTGPEHEAGWTGYEVVPPDWRCDRQTKTKR